MAKKDTRSLHEKRHITFAELGALLGTRQLLASGELVQSRNLQLKLGVHEFHMAEACKAADCGSITCIGGTMALIMGMNQSDAKLYVGNEVRRGHHSPSLQSLFFQPTNVEWSDVNEPIAVQAIDSWLKTGRVNWFKLVQNVR